MIGSLSFAQADKNQKQQKWKQIYEVRAKIKLRYRSRNKAHDPRAIPKGPIRTEYGTEYSTECITT